MEPLLIINLYDNLLMVAILSFSQTKIYYLHLPTAHVTVVVSIMSPVCHIKCAHSLFAL